MVDLVLRSVAWASLRNRLNLTRCYLWCFSSLQVHRTPPLAGKPRGGVVPFFSRRRALPAYKRVARWCSRLVCRISFFSFSFADRALLSHVHDPSCPPLRLALPSPHIAPSPRVARVRPRHVPPLSCVTVAPRCASPLCHALALSRCLVMSCLQFVSTHSPCLSLKS